ncbi:hypothetical protein Sango_2933900 [Sesamum angolense]|uniref:Uncharacterized protein n=1 Tax=Sesamum angolense TaxID=2727404 RepID=A0AAE1T5W9_9LAMI|nr:hypothetical protein Sango_2933900 [Sesamum angolense]
MASNTQQFGTRYDDPPRRSNEVSIAAFDDRLNELTSLVKKLAVERTQHVKTCGICTLPEHVTDMCPTLQEGPTEHADAIGGFFGQQQRRIFRGLNTDHLCAPSNPKQGTHLEDMMKSLISNTQQIQQNTQQQIQQLQQSVQTSIQNLESQLSQLASSVSKLESQDTRYARFLKELCTSKGKLKGNERASMGENVSAILQRKLPPNCKDPGTFTIPCKIGLIGIKRAMCDLGASINVMPLSIFESLHIGPLKEMGVVIQLADRLVVYPEGVLKDVLVQVIELVFPADFYVLDMWEDNSPSSTSILLGRPFLKTARTKIDVHAGALTMEFDGEIIRFNIFYSMRYPSDIPTALFVDAFDPFVQKFPAIADKNYIKLALEESPMPMEEENMGVDPLVQVNAKFDGDSVFLAKINKDLTYGPRTYKNKAFHDKISSRKNSLMNIKVFMGPHHLRKYYIEEVDSECLTYSS